MLAGFSCFDEGGGRETVARTLRLIDLCHQGFNVLAIYVQKGAHCSVWRSLAEFIGR